MNSEKERAAAKVVANAILESRDLQEIAQETGTEAAWADVLADVNMWSVSHIPGWHTIRDMNDEELCQTVVEDLLTVSVCAHRGAAAIYPMSQATRFCERSDHARIEKAIEHVIELGLISTQRTDAGAIHLSIPNEKLEAAQEYCGVYILDWDGEGKDMIDNLKDVGGNELVIDTIATHVGDVGDMFPDPAG